MWETRFLKKGYWPVTEVPKDLFSYFVSIQLIAYPDVRLCIDSSEAFQETLDTNPSFAYFWEDFPEIDPEKAVYFLALMQKESPPFKFLNIEQEYYKHLYEEEFDEMLEDERKQLEAEFEAIRLDSYQDVLKGEAIRLNCNVDEVRPRCPVLAFPSDDDGEQLRLADLPDEIFIKIMNLLDTLDVFQVTLVCKKWKSVVYNNPRTLRRAEHAKTTHLLTFTDWLDPTKAQSRSALARDYFRFSLGLVKWCCRTTEHLETVIIHNAVSFSDLQLLASSCPNLRNLQIGYGNDNFFLDDSTPYCIITHLTNLEFYCSYMYSNDYMSRLNTEVLASCESLRYFGGQMEISQIPELDTKHRMQRAFENLVALDLAYYNSHVLDILADTNGLQLRYFRLGYRDYSNPASRLGSEEVRLFDLLNKILRKLKTLEVFVMMRKPGIGNSTMKLLTQMRSNLKFAAFAEYSSEYWQNAREEWTPDVLAKFGKMLLSNDPELDLSQICLVVNNKNEYQDCRETNIGFTFIGASVDWYKIAWHDVALNDLSIKRRLGINF